MQKKSTKQYALCVKNNQNQVWRTLRLTMFSSKSCHIARNFNATIIPLYPSLTSVLPPIVVRLLSVCCPIVVRLSNGQQKDINRTSIAQE